ncbi:MAG: CPBP family glutamic-type intramembrane protease [Verrucomicrobiota bacterium]
MNLKKYILIHYPVGDILAALAPIPAMLIGLYVMNSGWTALLLYHLFIILTLLLFWKKFEGAMLIRGWRPMLALGVCVVCAVSGFILFIAKNLIIPDVSWYETLIKLSFYRDNFVLFIFYFSIVNPVLEEIHWRMILPRTNLFQRFPLALHFIFASYHILILALFLPWFLILPCVIGLMLAAWGWRWLVQKTGGLSIPILSHACADFSIALCVYCLVS